MGSDLEPYVGCKSDKGYTEVTTRGTDTPQQDAELGQEGIFMLDSKKKLNRKVYNQHHQHFKKTHAVSFGASPAYVNDM